MSILTIIVTGFALAMDAFAAAVAKGTLRLSWTKAFGMASLFGIFQGGMLWLGAVFGSPFQKLLEDYDHWVAFGLLAAIGINMIRESFKEEPAGGQEKLTWKGIWILAVATSIDALAVGFGLGLTQTSIWRTALGVGIITFLLSAFGVWAGQKFRDHLASKAELFGGVVLILLGAKILVEHLV
jgi:putative Mn2+ efflux pump MntP